MYPDDVLCSTFYVYFGGGGKFFPESIWCSRAKKREILQIDESHFFNTEPLLLDSLLFQTTFFVAEEVSVVTWLVYLRLRILREINIHTGKYITVLAQTSRQTSRQTIDNPEKIKDENF